jgi:hypothetical protein
VLRPAAQPVQRVRTGSRVQTCESHRNRAAAQARGARVGGLNRLRSSNDFALSSRDLLSHGCKAAPSRIEQPGFTPHNLGLVSYKDIAPRTNALPRRLGAHSWVSHRAVHMYVSSGGRVSKLLPRSAWGLCSARIGLARLTGEAGAVGSANMDLAAVQGSASRRRRHNEA